MESISSYGASRTGHIIDVGHLVFIRNLGNPKTVL